MMNPLRIIKNAVKERSDTVSHKTRRTIGYIIAGILLFCAGLVAGNVFVCSLYYFFAR